jgi:hypothetical protein
MAEVRGIKVIRPTTAWSSYGVHWNLIGHAPIIDHYKMFAYKDKGQRGLPRYSQLFVVSWAYWNPDSYESAEEKVAELCMIMNLNYSSFYHPQCQNDGRLLKGYLNIIYGEEVELTAILSFCRKLHLLSTKNWNDNLDGPSFYDDTAIVL